MSKATPQKVHTIHRKTPEALRFRSSFQAIQENASCKNVEGKNQPQPFRERRNAEKGRNRKISADSYGNQQKVEYHKPNQIIPTVTKILFYKKPNHAKNLLRISQQVNIC